MKQKQTPIQATTTEEVPLSTIISNPHNPRFIKDHKFRKLVKSIRSFPAMMALRPIVIDENNIALGGNMRLAALKEIGYQTIPADWVKRVTDLTEEQKKEFIIKDNVPSGEWDWDVLANEWDIQQLSDWDVDVPVFENPSPKQVTPKQEECIFFLVKCPIDKAPEVTKALQPLSFIEITESNA